MGLDEYIENLVKEEKRNEEIKHYLIGKKRGFKKATKKIAKNLLQMNVSIKFISEATGLKEEKILELQKIL